MNIQFTTKDLIFLVCIFGIEVGILLLPVIWNKKKVASALLSQAETNQE